MPTRPVRRIRHRPPLAALGLIPVTVLAATLQAGVLAPQFHQTVGGGPAPAEAVTLENTSWRSWHLTGVVIAGRDSDHAVIDGRLVRLSLRAGSLVGAGGTRRRSPAVLDVAPGRQFTVRLANADPGCSLPAAVLRERRRMAAYEQERLHLQTPVTALVNVDTAFGPRALTVPFRVSPCPAAP